MWRVFAYVVIGIGAVALIASGFLLASVAIILHRQWRHSRRIARRRMQEVEELHTAVYGKSRNVGIRPRRWF